MTWELGYFFGLASGGAITGLAALFAGSGYWERWTRQLECVTDQRDAALREASRWEGRTDDAEAAAARHRIERDCERRDLDACIDRLDAAEAERDEARDERDALAAAGLSAGDALVAAEAACAGLVAERDELRAELAAAREWEATAGDISGMLALANADIRRLAPANLKLDTELAAAKGELLACHTARCAAIAKADASDRRCQQAVKDRATAYDGMGKVVSLIEATRKECT